jgi:lipopolysaccharide transport system ATP-binding protein
LKILSRITEPTEGYADIDGRIGSLLEVGTGFHPELTGRENVFLNGAILGMKKTEIARKFDDIVGFAEVEKFLDTPVKYYSSGMYVRLAFAVAAHLQPQILLVDEVLAVGDIEFQKKCMGRMGSVVKEGKTVVIVSHNMATIRALCTSAVLLEQGRVKAAGAPEPIINQYLASSSVNAAERELTVRDHLDDIHKVRVTRIQLRNAVANTFSVHWLAPITVALDVEVSDPVEDVVFGASVRTVDDAVVFTAHSDLKEGAARATWDLRPGKYTVEFTLDNPLRPGLYKLELGAAARQHLGRSNLFTLDATLLEVLDFSAEGMTPRPSCAGVVNGKSHWCLVPASDSVGRCPGDMDREALV